MRKIHTRDAYLGLAIRVQTTGTSLWRKFNPISNINKSTAVKTKRIRWLQSCVFLFCCRLNIFWHSSSTSSFFIAHITWLAFQNLVLSVQIQAKHATFLCFSPPPSWTHTAKGGNSAAQQTRRTCAAQNRDDLTLNQPRICTGRDVFEFPFMDLPCRSGEHAESIKPPSICTTSNLLDSTVSSERSVFLVLSFPPLIKWLIMTGLHIEVKVRRSHLAFKTWAANLRGKTKQMFLISFPFKRKSNPLLGFLRADRATGSEKRNCRAVLQSRRPWEPGLLKTWLLIHFRDPGLPVCRSITWYSTHPILPAHLFRRKEELFYT